MDPCGIVCVLLIYGCVAYADYVITVWMVIPIFGDTYVLYYLFSTLRNLDFGQLYTSSFLIRYSCSLWSHIPEQCWLIRELYQSISTKTGEQQLSFWQYAKKIQ